MADKIKTRGDAKMLIQQGDVLFESVEKVKGAKVDVKGLLVEGEMTGHAHRIADADLDKVEVMKEFEQMFLHVKEDIDVVHEEHKTVTLPVGDYIVRKVREHDYWADEVRRVTD